MIGIYEIAHVAGRVYIGSSDNVTRRMKAHRSELRRGAHCNARLQRAWNRDGEAAFIFRVLESCTLGELREREAQVLATRERVFNTSPVVRRGAPASNATDADAVREIWLRGHFESIKELADEYGVHRATVARIVHGELHVAVTGGTASRPRGPACGRHNAKSKLHDAKRAIRKEYDGKRGSKTRLSKRYGVTVRAITLALR